MSDFNINFKYQSNGSTRYDSKQTYLQSKTKNRVENTFEEDYGEVETFDYEEFLEKNGPAWESTGEDSDYEEFKNYSLEDVLNYWKESGITILNLSEYNDASFLYKDSEVQYSDVLLKNGGYLSLDDEFVFIVGNSISKDDISEIKIEDNYFQITFKDNASNDIFWGDISNSEIKSCFVYLDGSIHINTKSGPTLWYDNIGNLTDATNTYSRESISSIFSDGNRYTTQYGGNQEDFVNHMEDLLEDEFVHNFLQEKFPNATDMDYYLYLKKIQSTGCSYVSLTNIIFDQFRGNPSAFKEIFGYDMYTHDKRGNIDYNYEYLILEIYTHAWQDYDIHDIYETLTENYFVDSDEDLKYFLNEDPLLQKKWKEMDFYRGSFDYECRAWLESFLMEKESALKLNIDVITEDNDYSIRGLEEYQFEAIREALKSGKNVKIGAQNYDLYIPTNDNSKGSIYVEGGYAHAMTVTGVTEDNNLIVSTWGKKYILDVTNSFYITATAYSIDISQVTPSLVDNYMIL